MGKRSDYPRRRNDRYLTPFAPVTFLRPHLPAGFTFCEPCAGDGRLVGHLVSIGGRCKAAIDIEPLADWISHGDARTLIRRDLRRADLIITNPPWTRSLLHPLIERFVSLAPAWLLFDADWIHTGQSQPYRRHLSRVVAVGRVRWIEGSANDGKDNAAWHYFDRRSSGETRFFGLGDLP